MRMGRVLAMKIQADVCDVKDKGGDRNHYGYAKGTPTQTCENVVKILEGGVVNRLMVLMTEMRITLSLYR